MARNAFTDDGPDSPAQRERRRRIIDATIALASHGGYEAVQMRAVADQAQVALGTLYRYFPSKIHLLVATSADAFDRVQETNRRRLIPGDTPRERVLHVLTRTTRALQRNPPLTEAMTRAFLFADASAAAEVDRVGQQMQRMFTHAMTPGGQPTEQQKQIAHVLGDVWLANLVAWITHRVSGTDLTRRLALTVRLLLPEEGSPPR